MATTGKLYGKALEHAFNGRFNYPSDTMKVMFLTSAYTFDASAQDTHDYVDDVNGAQVAIVSTALSSAASPGTTSISVAAFVAAGNFVNVDGEVRKVTNATGAGPYTLTLATALASAHALGAAVTSGQGYTAGGFTLGSKMITYTAGTNTLTLDAADLTTITGNPLGARYAVIYRDTGTAATSPLLAIVDFGDDQVATGGGSFTVQWDAAGIVTASTPA